MIGERGARPLVEPVEAAQQSLLNRLRRTREHRVTGRGQTQLCATTIFRAGLTNDESANDEP